MMRYARVWQAYLTGDDQTNGMVIKGGGPRPTAVLIDAKVAEAVLQFGDHDSSEDEGL